MRKLHDALFVCLRNKVLTRGNVRYSSGWCIVKLLYQMRGMWIINVEKLMRPNNRKTLHDSRSVNRAVSMVRCWIRKVKEDLFQDSYWTHREDEKMISLENCNQVTNQPSLPSGRIACKQLVKQRSLTHGDRHSDGGTESTERPSKHVRSYKPKGVSRTTTNQTIFRTWVFVGTRWANCMPHFSHFLSDTCTSNDVQWCIFWEKSSELASEFMMWMGNTVVWANECEFEKKLVLFQNFREKMRSKMNTYGFPSKQSKRPKLRSTQESFSVQKPLKWSESEMRWSRWTGSCASKWLQKPDSWKWSNR